MVAASKMRKAQQHALAGRPYATLMNKVLVSLQKRTDPRLHPLLNIRPLKKELVLIISTDKGLAGALNTNLFREAANFDSAKTLYVVTGKKARQFIARISREVDKVTVLYTQFINTINQRPVARTLLPISSFDLPKKHEESDANQTVDPMVGYVFEPNAETVLDVMLPYYLQYQVFQMILDARASEHSARMVAMKNATDNAKEFIKDLTLEYNKMRQASITTELLEIATAQMALGS